MSQDPSMMLAVAFPPHRGMKGALVTISDVASGLGRHRSPLLMSRREAVMTILRRNLTVYARGNGNRARRRAQAFHGRCYLDMPLAQPNSD